jgi:hypothetical protein
VKVVVGLKITSKKKKKKGPKNSSKWQVLKLPSFLGWNGLFGDGILCTTFSLSFYWMFCHDSHDSHDVIKKKTTSITTICHMQKNKTLTTDISDCIDFEICSCLHGTWDNLYVILLKEGPRKTSENGWD